MSPSRQALVADVRRLLIVTWPLVVNNVFNIGVDVADTVVAGRLGAAQLAAVAPGSTRWQRYR